MKEIYLYGEVGVDFTAKELAGVKGDLTVHINSGGGNVYDGLAIYNLLRKAGKVEISIDGLCASAASIIACAGKVTMAENGIFMIHLPLAGLEGYFNSTDLEGVQKSLEAVKSAILATYAAKTGKSTEELTALIESESWLSAAEAQELGFVDEISGAVAREMKGSLLIVNGVQFDCKGLDIKETVEMEKGSPRAAIFAENLKRLRFKKKMTRAQVADALSITETSYGAYERAIRQPDFDRLFQLAGILDCTASDLLEETVEMDEVIMSKYKDSVLAAERGRIKALTALKNGAAEVDAVIDVAIEKGKEAAEVEPYVEAIKAAQASRPASGIEELKALIKDNMRSGAEGVEGTAEVADGKIAQSDLISKYANEMVGAKNG